MFHDPVADPRIFQAMNENLAVKIARRRDFRVGMAPTLPLSQCRTQVHSHQRAPLLGL